MAALCTHTNRRTGIQRNGLRARRVKCWRCDPPDHRPNARVDQQIHPGGRPGGIAITDTDPNSFFNGVSIPIDYTNLYGFTGQYKSVSQFSAAINYTFPKTKYITIGVSYVDGRDLNTFEMQKLYKVTLGVKY